MYDLIDDVINNSGVSDHSYSNIGEFFAVIINLVMGIGFSISMISIVYAGFLYASSSGDPKKAKLASDTLLWGIVAVAISLGAVALRFMISRGIIGMEDANVVPSSI